MAFNKKNKSKHSFRLIGLRGKLLLVTLLLFILPIGGFNYLHELELFLKKNHSESVLDVANILASVFRDNASLISLNRLSQSANTPFYCHSLKTRKIIDGFSDDWFTLQNRQQNFLPAFNTQVSPGHKNLSLLCANDAQYYYFLISIKKPMNKILNSFGTIDFKQKKSFDSISFQYLDYYHQIQEYRFNMHSPGWVNGHLNNALAVGSQKLIRGEWQTNKQGFTFEFKVPASQINHYMAFKLQHSKTGNEIQTTIATIATAATAAPKELLKATDQLNPLMLTDPLSILRLKQLVPKNTRLWLLNKQQYVSAQTVNQLLSHTSNNNFSLLALYRRFYLIVMDYPEQQSFYGSNRAKIDSPAIQLTLEGKSSIEWLDNPHSDQMILSITVPVYDNDNHVIGTLVLEQTNDTLLALQDNTFEQILLLSIVLFFTIALTLLFFSTRLLKRIINLRDDTNIALSNDGKICNQLFRNDNDEIGDLARSFSTLLARIEQNNQYLRTLSGKLSHELRTPLTIIKSSLENIETSARADDKQKYVQRAHEGCIRLNNLLNRMSEASRLEQSIDSMDKEPIELVAFLSHYFASIQAAHEDIKFMFNSPINSLTIEISPELMAQLFDKLISNAISFHKEGTPIKLSMTIEDEFLLIELNNQGKFIDKDKLNSIFSSLTSYRTKKAQDAHLGIGLYIARLISQFHNGKLEALNNEHNQSVSFILTIPIRLPKFT